MSDQHAPDIEEVVVTYDTLLKKLYGFIPEDKFERVLASMNRGEPPWEKMRKYLEDAFMADLERAKEFFTPSGTAVSKFAEYETLLELNIKRGEFLVE